MSTIVASPAQRNRRDPLVTDGQWTPAALTDLLVSNGVAGRVAARQADGLLFDEAAPTPTPPRPGAPEHPATPCLMWRGTVRARTGHGRVAYGGRVTFVHRVVLDLLGTPIPDGMHGAHLCERAGCAHPLHVRATTPHQNIKEGAGRIYPDWLLAMAPNPGPCPKCHEPLVLVTPLVIGGRPQRWQWTCGPCQSKYMKATRAGLQRPATGIVAVPMSAGAAGAVQTFIDGRRLGEAT